MADYGELLDEARERAAVRDAVDAALQSAGVREPAPQPAAQAPAGSTGKPASFVTQIKAVQKGYEDPLAKQPAQAPSD